MTAELGTLRWACETGGVLTARERRRLLRDGARLQLEVWANQIARALRLSRGGRARVELADLQLPDSSTSRAAEAACRQLTSQAVINHSYRTYLWGIALAGLDGVRFDRELLFVASMLHDLGLEPGPRSEGRCFTLAGAEAALALAHEDGWSEARREAAAEAVTLHMNVRVDVELSPEGHLVNSGAVADVTGIRFHDLDARSVARVIERYPRANMNAEFGSRIAAQIASAPGTRAHFYETRLGLGRARARTPWPE